MPQVSPRRQSRRGAPSLLLLALAALTFVFLAHTPATARAAFTYEDFCDVNLNPSSGYCDTDHSRAYLQAIYSRATAGGWSCAEGVIAGSGTGYACAPENTWFDYWGGISCPYPLSSHGGVGRIRSDSTHNGAVHTYHGKAEWDGSRQACF